MSIFGPFGTDDQTVPLSELSEAEIYRLPIADSRIDLPARLFRECEAMLAHIATRGIEADKQVFADAGLLEVGIKDRDVIPLQSLMQLHQDLSTAIAPALPGSVELLQWDARKRPVANFFAPVRPVRWLLALAFLSIFAFSLILVIGDLNEQDIARPILAVEETQGDEPASALHNRGERAILLFYFLSLAAIGTIFGTLYDARKYIVAGQYDPRAANYTIRLLLGLIAGLLLSQVLANSPTGSNGKDWTLASISSSFLALIGGFASQFVYQALKKIVDGLESIFDPGKELKVLVETQKQELAKQQAAAAEAADKSAEVTRIAGQIANAGTEEARKQWTEVLVDTLTRPDGEAAGAVIEAPQAEKAEADLKDIESTFEAKAEFLMLLPEDEAKEAGKEAALIREKLEEAKKMSRVSRASEVLAALAGLASLIGRFNPIGLVAASSLTVISGLLGAGQEKKVPPLLQLLIAASRQLDARTYKNWKDVVLDQRDAAPDLAIDEAVLGGAQSLVGQIPVIGTTLMRALTRKRPGEESTALAEILQELLTVGKQAAVEKIRDDFEMDEPAARELVAVLSAYLAARDGLGDAARNALIGVVGDKIGLPIEALIAFARQAVEAGPDGQAVVERLISLADAAADTSSALPEKEVERAFEPKN